MKQNFLLLTAAALVFAGCSTTVERTSSAFGGGWGTDSKKSNPTKTEASVTAEKNTTQMVVVDETPIEDIQEKEFNNSSANETIKVALAKSDTKKSFNLLKPITSKFDKKILNIKKKASAVNMTGQGSGFSIASLVIGIIGLFIFGWLLGPLAIIFGAIGMNRDGRGMAIAGLILGIVDILLWLLLLLILLASF